MSIEQNRAVAIEFFSRFSQSDIVGALELMTDEATWLIPGKSDDIPSAGLYNKERIGKLFHYMVKQ